MPKHNSYSYIYVQGSEKKISKNISGTKKNSAKDGKKKSAKQLKEIAKSVLFYFGRGLSDFQSDNIGSSANDSDTNR